MEGHQEYHRHAGLASQRLGTRQHSFTSQVKGSTSKSEASACEVRLVICGATCGLTSRLRISYTCEVDLSRAALQSALDPRACLCAYKFFRIFPRTRSSFLFPRRREQSKKKTLTFFSRQLPPPPPLLSLVPSTASSLSLPRARSSPRASWLSPSPRPLIPLRIQTARHCPKCRASTAFGTRWRRRMPSFRATIIWRWWPC